MNISDPIADMLTRIRNASRARHAEVLVPASKLKAEMAQILVREGFVASARPTSSARCSPWASVPASASSFASG